MKYVLFESSLVPTHVSQLELLTMLEQRLYNLFTAHARAQRIYDSLSFYGILYRHATTDVDVSAIQLMWSTNVPCDSPSACRVLHASGAMNCCGYEESCLMQTFV